MSSPLVPLPDRFAASAAALHRVAERLVAPARKPDNEIALEATPGGFGTPRFEWGGARRRVRVEGVELVQEIDAAQRRAPLETLATAAAAVAELLPAGVELDEEPLAVDPEAAAALASWYAFGTAVLAELAASAAPADAPSPPILWPEHFDVAIELGDEAAGERATYGFSPGDENHPEPYAYVAPWAPQPPGGPWNARGFGGAELGYAELAAAADPGAEGLRFLLSRQRALAGKQETEEER